MTNKEAIEALKRIRDEAIENFIGEWSDYEAFGIAIKTLEGADDYERAIEQTKHDMLYEPTYNSEDGSM